MKVRLLVVVALLLGLSSCRGGPVSTDCSNHWGGRTPVFRNEKLAAKTQDICYGQYGLIYSPITLTPLAAAEHLTRERLTGARLERKNEFHPDPNLSPSDRAELEDYARSGYDRGHMAPSGDMSDQRSQHESFSLANMIPQNRDDNRNLWEGIEAAVRYLARRSGELYVVTGPIFHGPELKRINGRVLVPTHIFKAVYDPEKGEAGAYLVENAGGMRYAVISISDLERLSGLSVFPELSEGKRKAKMDLPIPKPHNKMAAVEDESLIPR